MTKTLRIAIASLAAALMVGGLGVTAASATTVYPGEGGVWTYGVRVGGIYGTRGEVYSNYVVNRLHRSTACGISCDVKSYWTSAGAESRSTALARSSGNTAYYNVL